MRTAPEGTHLGGNRALKLGSEGWRWATATTATKLIVSPLPAIYVAFPVRLGGGDAHCDKEARNSLFKMVVKLRRGRECHYYYEEQRSSHGCAQRCVVIRISGYLDA
jgi:hypothetical protein